MDGLDALFSSTSFESLPPVCQPARSEALAFQNCLCEIPHATTDGARLSRRGVERLDMLLLTIEALDLNGGEAMVWTSQQMGLQAQFPNPG